MLLVPSTLNTNMVVLVEDVLVAAGGVYVMSNMPALFITWVSFVFASVGGNVGGYGPAE